MHYDDNDERDYMEAKKQKAIYCSRLTLAPLHAAIHRAMKQESVRLGVECPASCPVCLPITQVHP